MKKLVFLLTAAMLAGGAFYLHHQLAGAKSRSDQGRGRTAHSQTNAKGPVPVVLAVVSNRRFPVWLDGLGTVEALNTVTVRAQISGQLVSVPFKEGAKIKKGQLIAQIDPRPFEATLAQGLAKLAQDRAQLISARQDLRRYERLAPKGYISRQQLDQQHQLVSQYSALVEGDNAAVESDRIQLSYTRIKAPISGRLGLRQIDVGNLVSPSDTAGIVTITEIQPIALVFTLPEQDLPVLREHDAASRLLVEALSRDNNQVLARGKLLAINNQIDQSTGTIELKAIFANPEERLWPGEFVNVRILVSTLSSVPVVPMAAIQRGPNGPYVYVVGPSDVAKLKDVTVGRTQDGVTHVITGLRAGEHVVINGAYELAPGVKIRQGPDRATSESVVHQGRSS